MDIYEKMGYSAIMLLFVVVSILIVSSCMGEQATRPEPKWTPGAMVRSVVNNQVGQIIRAYCRGGKQPACYYDVRFPGQSMTTDTHLLTADGPISSAPLAVVEHMREYELE